MTSPTRLRHRSRFLCNICILLMIISLSSTADEDPLPHSQKEHNSSGNPAWFAERKIIAMDSVQLLSALRDGDLRSEPVVGELLERIERYPELNAVIHMDREKAMADARDADDARDAGIDLGPLHGLPVLIKDSLDTADYPTTGGTPALMDHQPANNAAVVQALVDAGAIVLGKTNLHELSSGYTTSNPFTGQTLNPYDFGRVPGGSSGGNGAALAARMAPLAIGGDTAGSVRIPAALNGLAGFRPTTGRYDTTGVIPISPTLDAVGPMARSVRDLALADAVLANEVNDLPPVELTGLRLAIPRAYFYERLDPQTAKAINQAFARLTDAGAELVEADFPLASELTREFSLFISLYESPAALANYLDGTGVDPITDLLPMVASPDVAYFLQLAVAGVVSPADYAGIKGFVEGLLKPAYLDYLASGDFDAVLIPSVVAPAQEIGTGWIDSVGLDLFSAYSRTGHFTPLIGAPTATVPIGQASDRLPLGGLDVSAAPGDDRRVLAIAQAIEQVLPRIRPPLSIQPLPAGR